MRLSEQIDRQAERDGLRPGWKVRLKDGKIEVI